MRYIPDPDLYDLDHVAGWGPDHLHDLGQVPAMDLYYTDPAQHLSHSGGLGST